MFPNSTIIDVWLGGYGCRRTYFYKFSGFGLFTPAFPPFPPDRWINRILQQSGDNLILHKCIRYDHWMFHWEVITLEGSISIILLIFWTFYPPNR